MARTKIIKVLSDDHHIREKIGLFCTGQDTCSILWADSIIKKKDCDVILIAQDKLHLLLSKDYYPVCPTVFLRQDSDSSFDDKTQLKKLVDEIIDIKKITSGGFFRALENASEKFYIKNELRKQKIALKELALFLGENTATIDSIDSIDYTEISPKKLFEANKKLIDMLRQQNNELKNLSRIDILTKIGNRLNFEETLTTMMAHAHRHKHMIGLLMIDLDKFKNVNDTYGHQAGDLLLQQAAQRLKNLLRKEDFIARLGGDEFAIILNEIKGPHAASIVSWKIIQEMTKPFQLNDIVVSVDASIGIACYPLISDNIEDLVKNADSAMYQAKKSDTVKYAFAKADIETDYLKRARLEDELKSAIQSNELKMVYQPIYAIPSGNLHGFEALIRWDNRILGKISPAEFIPIAEDSGLIHVISKWVLQTVCKQIAEWQGSYHFPYKISINLSPSQLSESDLVQIVLDIIDTHKISLKLIEFEITEVAALQKSQVVSDNIHTLSNLGASHALDDFGTGFSSIQHLRYLPVSTIKIDQSFIQGLGLKEMDESLVASIIALAKRMGLKVVAEGVETKDQLNALIREECDYAQGFLFSKPLSAAQATQLISSKENSVKVKK